MFPRSLLAALMVTLLGTGCVVHDHGYEDDYDHGEYPVEEVFPGDVTFSWTFAGLTCQDTPEIHSVRVSIPGQLLANDGIYPCSVNGYPGITLHDFVPGGYSFTVEAMGYGGEVLYATSGVFNVNGDILVRADLTPLGAPSSYAYVSWSFPANSESANPTCSVAGVTWIEISIDGGNPVRFDCARGMVAPGIQTPFLAPGTHSIEIWGLADDGYPYYYLHAGLQTFGGSPVAAEYELDWNVGGVAIGWQLNDGGTLYSCSQAGVQNMTINFVDSSGQTVYGAQGDAHACNAAPIVYNFLLPGTYKVYVSGTGPNGVRYVSNTQNPPRITVVAGQFVDASSALAVQLFRVN